MTLGTGKKLASTQFCSTEVHLLHKGIDIFLVVDSILLMLSSNLTFPLAELAFFIPPVAWLNRLRSRERLTGCQSQP